MIIQNIDIQKIIPYENNPRKNDNAVDKHAQKLTAKGKHKYIFCFDKKLRKKYLKQSLPYPKKDV